MIRPNDRLIGFDKFRTKIPCTRYLLAFRGPGFGSGKKDGDLEGGKPRFATFSPHPHPILAAL
jgi:hypothetical protein